MNKPENTETQSETKAEIKAETDAGSGTTTPIPDRLSIDPRSPHHIVAVFEHEIGIRLNDREHFDVAEYCISEGWVKVPAGLSRLADKPGSASL